MQRKTSKIRLTPFSIVFFYACIGGIWLLVSFTKIVSFIFHTPLPLEMAELNHSVFILVSAWLLYFLIRKSESDIKQRKDSLSKANRSLKAYSECHQALMRSTDEIQLMKDVCRTIVEVGGYRVAWVGRAENDEELSIRPVVQWGDELGYLKNLNVSWSNTSRGMGPTGTAIRSGKPVVAKYIEYDPKWELWRENALRHGFLSSISLPLIVNGRATAALIIFAGEKNAFDDDEVALLTDLADDLSYGITTLQAAAERKIVGKEYMMLASIIEQAKEGIFLFNGEGDIMYVNPAVESITGRLPKEMIGHNISTLEFQQHNRKFYDAIMNTISREEEKAGRFRYKRKDGVMLDIDVDIWSVSDTSGTDTSYAALIRDVTHEIQLERQLRQAQRMEAIGTLAGGISHDFNNTLASIITCAEMALDEIPPGKPLQELLDVILKSGLRGKSLVKQILTFSRHGEQELQEVRVEVIVNESLKLLRASLPASIEIRANMGNETGQIFADPTQIHQVVINLCTNAVHAMRGQPHGVLEISLENAEIVSGSPVIKGIGNLAPGRYLRLTVKDSGHGMTPKVMERIFDPFFTTKAHAEGTGLGLSVIHGIVKNHGGHITVASEPGCGAEFCVLLPRIDTVKPVEETVQTWRATSGNERILLVDDEEDLALASQRMLNNLGYQVIAWSDPHSALQMFRAQPGRFDLVITDQTMPKMNGTELARELALIRPDIPIILCTGYDLSLSGVTTCNGETAEYITEVAIKPLERIEIAALIRRVLDASLSQDVSNG